MLNLISLREKILFLYGEKTGARRSEKNDKMQKRIATIFLATGLWGACFGNAGAQNVRARLSWSGDSIAVGKPIEAYFIVERPENIPISVADSLQYFSPYELQKRRTASVKLDDGTVRDSFIYTLVSFEIDSVQYLRLAYSYFAGERVVHEKTAADSVVFASLVPIADPAVAFRAIVTVDEPQVQNKNLWYAIIFSGSAAFILAAYFFLKDPLVRAVKRYLLTREKRRWLKRLAEIQKETQTPAPTFVCALNRLWKEYLTGRASLFTNFTSWERPSLTALTAEEVKALWRKQKYLPEKDASALNTLAGAENRICFGGQTPSPEERTALCRALHDFFENEFQRRKKSIV